MRFDASQVNRNLDKFSEVFEDACREGLGAAGVQLMNDTVQDIPQTPILTSALRGSGAVFVSGKKVADSTHGIPEFRPDARASSNKATDKVGEALFNAPYAFIQHEAYKKKSIPTAGMKYLERKIYGNAREYFKTIANTINNRIKGFRTIA